MSHPSIKKAFKKSYKNNIGFKKKTIYLLYYCSK